MSFLCRKNGILSWLLQARNNFESIKEVQVYNIIIYFLHTLHKSAHPTLPSNSNPQSTMHIEQPLASKPIKTSTPPSSTAYTPFLRPEILSDLLTGGVEFFTFTGGVLSSSFFAAEGFFFLAESLAGIG